MNRSCGSLYWDTDLGCCGEGSDSYTLEHQDWLRGTSGEPADNRRMSGVVPAHLGVVHQDWVILLRALSL